MREAETDFVAEVLLGAPGPDAPSEDGSPAAAPVEDDTRSSAAAAARSLAHPAPEPVSPRESSRAMPAPTISSPARRARRAPHLRVAAQPGKAAAIALAFVIGVGGVLVVFLAVAFAIAFANADHVLPGVHVGAIDVSGLSRQEAIDKLNNAYSYLSLGEVEITTPKGTSTVDYSAIGRAPDAEAMADAALRAGRTGNLLGDAVTTWRSAIAGQEIPLAVRIDPEAVSAQVRLLTLTSSLPPRDAETALFYDTFVYWPAARGSMVDEDAVGLAIMDHLTDASAPSPFQVGSALIAIQPEIDDAEAQHAIEAAERMAVDVTLTLGSDASPGPSQSTPAPAKTYVVPAAVVRTWILFGADEAGAYGPGLDLTLIEEYLASLPGTVIVPPTEPRVVFDSAGTPVSVTGGQNGVGVDNAASAKAIEAYLLSLARGGTQQAAILLSIGTVEPRIDIGDLSELTVMGGGDASWTTIFYPGETNGDGLNIRTPAALLNGQIVAPGGQFSFLDAVSPIDEAHGYTWGGVILHGKSDHTGAMGGGICSASTTMFNAALRAGLQIDERHPHAYYIDRYPAGLDATVFQIGSRPTDLRWTNDTPYPIVIRAWATNRSKSTITIQLWSMPYDRTVILDYPPQKLNIVKAGDTTVYVDTRPPGEKYRTEWPTDGYDIVRTRTVFDVDGTLIHSDTWSSHYIKVDGILEIGATPSPSPATPTPSPTAFFPVAGLGLLRAAQAAGRRVRAA
jgi:vancomycin resistance protein YoaR